MAGSLALLMTAIPKADRAACCRELRALALVYLGLRHPATVALAKAVADPAAGPRALTLLDAAPALPRRRLLSAYRALMARAETRLGRPAFRDKIGLSAMGAHARERS
jgi:hypothetical protein